MFKKIVLSGMVLLLSIVLMYLVAVYQNNKEVEPVSAEVARLQLDRAMSWLKKNRDQILGDNNPMLWWMIYESHQLSHDPELAQLLSDYFERHESMQTGAWAPLFGGKRITYIRESSLKGLPYYNKHFIYSLNCAENLPYDSEIIAQQNTKEFCHQASYFFRPACLTHQLMGINFIKQNQCNAGVNVDEVMLSLQDDILNQLVWDVRPVDVYMQRVLMLYITGAGQKIKPVWVKRILDNQLEDGGWDDFAGFMPLGGGKYLGYAARGIAVKQPRSAFHPTAQGIYLLTMLLYNH